MNSTSETANENFITDHGSIFFSCNLARRGPREAAAATVARTLRTASPTWVRAVPAPAAPTLADPTTLALPIGAAAPITEVRAPLVCAAVGGPAGRVWVGGALVRGALVGGALVGGALVGAPGTLALPDPAAGGPDGFATARSDELSGGGTGGTEVPPWGCWPGDDGEFTTDGRTPPGTLGAVGGFPPAPETPAPEPPEPPGAPEEPGAPAAEGRAAPLEPGPDGVPGGVEPPG